MPSAANAADAAALRPLSALGDAGTPLAPVRKAWPRWKAALPDAAANTATSSGDAAASARELGVEPLPSERQRSLEKLRAKGQIEQSGERLRVPKSQWLFADGIISELL